MKRCVLNRAFAAIALGAAAVLPAQAAYIDFEDVGPLLFSASSISSNGFDFASSGTGFSGVDAAVSFSLFANAPGNSTGQFLFGLSADALTMTQTGGGAFRLAGFDFSFVAPVGGLVSALSPGRLHIEAVAAGGGVITEDIDFGDADLNGNWSFSGYNSGALANGVTSVSFSACTYDGGGGCVTDNQAQFAVDNLRVPEPASAALVLAALGLLAATRRRQSL